MSRRGTPASRRCFPRLGWRFSTSVSRTALPPLAFEPCFGAPQKGFYYFFFLAHREGTPKVSGPLLTFPYGLHFAKLVFEGSLLSSLYASLSCWW